LAERRPGAQDDLGGDRGTAPLPIEALGDGQSELGQLEAGTGPTLGLLHGFAQRLLAPREEEVGEAAGREAGVALDHRPAPPDRGPEQAGGEAGRRRPLLLELPLALPAAQGGALQDAAVARGVRGRRGLVVRYRCR